MKKIILLMFMAVLLSAQTESDIAFTAGYNKFDDPLMLRKHRGFYGVRGGVYQSNGFGFQLGYEQAIGANCQGLNLKRIYTNALLQSTQLGKLKPYGLLSAGYEMSNIHEHKPDQTFIGAGVGAKYMITDKVSTFLETRVLRKLKSDDTDIITTLGLAYTLDSGIPIYKEQREIVRKVAKPIVSTPVTIHNEYVQPVKTYAKPYIEPIVVDTQKHYYVQLIALSRTNAEPFLQKLYAQGINNAEVKEIYRGGKTLSVVVVGPFYDREEATRNLRILKRVRHDAFITKL